MHVREIKAVYTHDGALDAGKWVWVTNGGGRFYIVLSSDATGIHADRVHKNGEIKGWSGGASIEWADAIEIEAPASGPVGQGNGAYHRLDAWTSKPVPKVDPGI